MAEQLLAVPETFARESDKRLFLALRRRLWDYEPLRATRPELNLEVDGGTVRLSGRVRTQAMKEIVSYLCGRQEGLTTLQNDVISDTEVVRDVADALGRDAQLAPCCLRVDARYGAVTLSGEVPSPDLEAAAVAVAGAVASVARVAGAPAVISEVVVRRAARPTTAETAGS